MPSWVLVRLCVHRVVVPVTPAPVFDGVRRLHCVFVCDEEVVDPFFFLLLFTFSRMIRGFRAASLFGPSLLRSPLQSSGASRCSFFLFNFLTLDSVETVTGSFRLDRPLGIRL